VATVSRGFVLLAVLALAFPAESLAAHAGPNYCGVDIPDDEALGFVQLPHGDVFCPLLADPKSSGVARELAARRVRRGVRLGHRRLNSKPARAL